jgi:hypothetical protein
MRFVDLVDQAGRTDSSSSFLLAAGPSLDSLRYLAVIKASNQARPLGRDGPRLVVGRRP